MIVNLYAIKDIKIDYGTPFALPNNAVALRTFKDLANDSSRNIVNEAIEDKELWLIGSYDTSNGVVASNLTFIAKAGDVFDGKKAN